MLPFIWPYHAQIGQVATPIWGGFCYSILVEIAAAQKEPAGLADHLAARIAHLGAAIRTIARRIWFSLWLRLSRRVDRVMVRHVSIALSRELPFPLQHGANCIGDKRCGQPILFHKLV